MMEIQLSTESQESQSKLQVGLARFKPGCLKTIEHLLAQSPVKHLLSRQNWRIKGKPFRQKWRLLFEQLYECLCERLFIESMECESLMVSIEACSFPYMTVLNLSHNPIASIESLSFLNAPNLQFIFLQTNHISSFKPLSKAYFNSLEQLDFSSNKIQQISAITRLKASTSKSFSIELFTFGHSHHHHWHEDEHSCTIQSISMMAKLQHSIEHKEQDANKKYQMLRRQFDYMLAELHSNVQFMNSITQTKPLKALSRKFDW